MAQSLKLLDALRSTRLFLTEGQHSWGEPQAPCENACKEFKSLYQHIGGMHAALVQHSKEVAGEAFSLCTPLFDINCHPSLTLKAML